MNERVPNGGQQNVASRLIRFGLERKPQPVAAVDRVLGECVQSLPIPIKRGPNILGEVDL